MEQATRCTEGESEQADESWSSGYSMVLWVLTTRALGDSGGNLGYSHEASDEEQRGEECENAEEGELGDVPAHRQRCDDHHRAQQHETATTP